MSSARLFLFERQRLISQLTGYIPSRRLTCYWRFVNLSDMSRIQEERSAETRRRLLQATVDCLYERGYAGATTAEIANRAGVSKGAELHHFPTKDQLVVSALEYLFDLRLAASSDPDSIAKLPDDRKERLAAIVDLLVPIYRDKIFFAWLELVVASRTDVAIRQAVRRVSDRYSQGILKVWKKLFGAPEDDPEAFRVLSGIINGQFAAIALGSILNGGQSDSDEERETVEALKEIGAALLDKHQQSRRTP
jgi:AcrR family transcriptional regulator